MVPNSEYELYDHLSNPDQATSSAAPRAAKAAAVTIGAIMVAVLVKRSFCEEENVLQIRSYRGVAWVYEGRPSGKSVYGPLARLALSTIQCLVKPQGPVQTLCNVTRARCSDSPEPAVLSMCRA